jgi:hypothetical protein
VNCPCIAVVAGTCCSTEPGFQPSYEPRDHAAARSGCYLRVLVHDADTATATHATVLQVKPGHAALRDIQVQEDREKAGESFSF